MRGNLVLLLLFAAGGPAAAQTNSWVQRAHWFGLGDGDALGQSVDCDGNLMVAGSPYHGRTVGTNVLDEAGLAYIFERNQPLPDFWGVVAQLLPPDPAEDDHAGAGVAVDGNLAIVGVPNRWVTEVRDGAAFLFARDEGGPNNWGNFKRIRQNDPEPDSYFGASVDLDGDLALVGATGQLNPIEPCGAAYLFSRNQGGANNWGQIAKLGPLNGAAQDWFGGAVALDGSTVLVGAFMEIVVAGHCGAAYVFERDYGGNGNWGRVRRLTAPIPRNNDAFGYDVALDGDTAVVGALQYDFSHGNEGAAFVFERNAGGPGQWGWVATLRASDEAATNYFGASVSVHRNTILVGALGEDSATLNGGAVYVFQRSAAAETVWTETAKLTSSSPQTEAYFGGAVALSGYVAAVGAQAENGLGTERGAAYVFEDTNPPWPCITQLVHGSSSVLIRWPGVAGRTYQVEYRNVMGGGPGWTGLPGHTNLQGSNTAMTATDSAPSPTSRFYRIGASD